MATATKAESRVAGKLAVIAIHRQTWLERAVKSVETSDGHVIGFGRIDTKSNLVTGDEAEMADILETLEAAYGASWTFELISEKCFE